MTSDERVRLAFTGPDSHVLTRRPGVGSLTVGPVGGREKPDLAVGPDDAVDWTVFDAMRVPDGNLWPRYVRYEGADTSILGWSRVRRVEGVTFTAVRDTVLDADGAQIHQLHVRTEGHHVTLHVASVTTCPDLVITGDLTRVELHGHPDGTVPRLGIVLPAAPAGPARGLPPLPALAGATSLDLRVDPLGAPFDCRTLLQLPGLRSLTLQGALAHLDALAALPLTSLAIRFCPDLTGLPPLTTWPGLTSLIAWNVDEEGGKRLRAELRALGEGHFSDHVSVSQLRARRWFVEEYGLPFGAWPARSAKKATTLYKAASRSIAKATDQREVRAAIRTFVDGVNDLPGIETTEREDAGDAVHLLASTSPVPVEAETAQSWFDEARQF